MKKQFALIVVLALALILSGCGKTNPQAVFAANGEEANPASFEALDAPQVVPTAVPTQGNVATAAIQVETVEVNVPDCGKGVTQIDSRDYLTSYPGECSFLFEGTIPDDATLKTGDASKVHQIWTLEVANLGLLANSARGSFWIIEFGWKTSDIARDFLASKCKQGLTTPAVMRWVENSTLKAEARACP